MKTTLALLLAASLAVACSSSVSPDASSGVTLTTTSSTPPLPSSASIRGAGDSVVATVVAAATCGKTLSADAAVTPGRLVITISLTATAPQNCLPIFASTTYRAVVHRLAAGSYDASVDYRSVFGTAVSDSTVARTTVALP